MHPWAWWAWALGLTVAASRTTSVPGLVLVLVSALLVATLARGDGPRARAFPGYVLLAAAVVVMRVGFYVLVGFKTPGTVILDLPRIPMPDWAVGVQLLGPVTAQGLGVAAVGGLRLAALVLCVGAAGTLTSAARTLRTLPAALHQIGTAVVIAINIAPALVAAAARVRRAQRLRGLPARGLSSLVATIMPVLTDALDQSVALAASMDSRGFTRTHGHRDARVGPLLLGSLVAATLGIYGVLDPGAPGLIGVPMLVLAAMGGGLGSVLASRLVRRSQFRRERWTAESTLVSAAGVAAAALVTVTAGSAGGASAVALGLIAAAPLAVAGPWYHEVTA